MVHRIWSAVVRAIAALAVLGAGAACGAAQRSDTGGDEQSPVIAVHGWSAYPVAEVSGRLRLDAGCLLLGDSVAFWADGTSWDPQERSVVLESGDHVQVGEEFVGGGGHYSEGDLDGLDGVDIDALIGCLDRTGLSDAVIAVPPTSRD